MFLQGSSACRETPLSSAYAPYNPDRVNRHDNTGSWPDWQWGLLLPLHVRQLQLPAGITRCDPAPRFHQKIPYIIKDVLCGYQHSDKAGLMQEGFYWIRHNGRVQVAYYTDGETEDLQSGRIVRRIWHLTRGFDICDDGEAEVLQGPLSPPL